MDLTGAYFAELLEEFNVQQKELADAWGMTQSGISKLISRGPSKKHWRRLVDFLKKRGAAVEKLEAELMSYSSVINEPDNDSKLLDQLTLLSSLYEKGLLSPEEFKRAKEIVLDTFEKGVSLS